MPEEPRRNRVFLQENTKPLEGTEKHPQGRLFNPTGQFSGDPWKLQPENWMKQSDTPAHDDLITWHSSEESQLARTDEYEDRAFDPGHGTGPDWDPDWDDEDDDYDYDNRFSEDSKERPMGSYGSAVGMHFGSPAAAQERSTRSFLHPVRIPNNTMADPPSGGFSTEVPGGSSVSDMHRSHRDIVDSHTGDRTPDERWSDKAANYSEAATDLVEEGKTLAYRNDVEAVGSTSYRALPETTRTWGEDVMAAKNPMTGRPASEKYGWNDDQAFRNAPHPGLVAAAVAGYNPVTRPYKGDSPNFSAYNDPLQLSLPFDNKKEAPRHGRPVATETTSDGTPYAPSQEENYERMARRSQSLDMNKASASRREAFNAGTLWSMQQPNSIG